MIHLVYKERLPEDLEDKILTFWKGANVIARKMELMENQLSRTTAAENAHKARRKQSNKVLQSGGVLYAKNARNMTQDRRKLEDEKQQQREEAREKRYLNALKQVYKATRPHRAARIKLVKGFRKKWRVVLKQLLKNRRVYKG